MTAASAREHDREVRVLLVNLTPFYGGGEVYLRRLMAGLHHHGIPVALHTVAGPLPEVVRGDHPDAQLSLSRVNSYAAAPLLLPEILHALAAAGASVLHLNGVRALHMASILAPVRCVKVVTYHLDSPLLSRSLIRPLYGLFLGGAARGLDRIICVCDFQRTQLAYWIPAHKLCTVHNGVPLAPLPNNGMYPDAFTVLLVGRLVETKGHLLLFQAISNLIKKRQIKVRAVCLGEGPARESLAKFLREQELEGAIELAGFVPSLEAHLHRASVVVLPSRHEGLPLSLLEAMACGKPVIATAVAGVPEIVVDGHNGYLIPPGDYLALEDRLAFLASHPQVAGQMGIAARQTVENRFEVSLMVERTVQVYRDCLEERERRTR